MANQQFRKVKLIDSQDAVYLDFCTECALKRQSLKPKLPQTAINKLSLLFEDVMRNLLAEYFTLTGKRILAFEEKNNQFGYIQKYREIDAIGVERSQPSLLFEIKTSSNPKPQTIIRRAKEQLEESKKVSSFLNKNLKLCIVYIDIFSEERLQSYELSLSDVDFYNTIDSLQTNMLEGRVSCIVFSGVEIWHQAIIKGLIDNSSLWTEAQTEIEENIDKRQQREVLIAEGVSPEDFPEFLKPETAKKTSPTILQFGEFNGATSFQQAFLKAQKKQESQHLIAG